MARRLITSAGIRALATMGRPALMASPTSGALRSMAVEATNAAAQEQQLQQQQQQQQPQQQGTSMKRRWHQGPAFLKMLINFTDVKIDNFGEIAQKTGAGTFLSNRGDWFPFMKGIPRKALLLHGEGNEVLAAFESLQDRYQQENPKKEKLYLFLVPRLAAKQLIGPGGENIQKVEKETGAKIEVDKTPADTVIGICGASSAVKAAVVWLLDQQQKQGGYLKEMKEIASPSYRMDLLYTQDEKTEIFIPLRSDDVGRFIGEDGQNIKRMAQIAQCQLRFEWNMKGLNGETILRIGGAVGDVHTTHKYIVRYLRYLEETRAKESKKSKKSNKSLKATVPT